MTGIRVELIDNCGLETQQRLHRRLLDKSRDRKVIFTCDELCRLANIDKPFARTCIASKAMLAQRVMLGSRSCVKVAEWNELEIFVETPG